MNYCVTWQQWHVHDGPTYCPVLEDEQVAGRSEATSVTASGTQLY